MLILSKYVGAGNRRGQKQSPKTKKKISECSGSERSDYIHRPHHGMVYFYNHVNKLERQSSRGGGFKLRKKATQASLFNHEN
jgi:hypothetical protein